MKIFNKTDMSISVPLAGEAGNRETLTLQPYGRVELPAGFSLAREMKQIRVEDVEDLGTQEAKE